MTGCASIVNGTKENVMVNTINTPGAECSLTNDKGKWYVNNTPESVTVHRSFKQLIIHCKKKGFKPADINVDSKTKAMAYGNLVIGGLVGASIDSYNGSAFDYPTNIEIPMKKGLA